MLLGASSIHGQSMRSFRFSLLQFVLLTSLVGIVLAGYRAFVLDSDFAYRGHLQFFPDGQRLLFTRDDSWQVREIGSSNVWTVPRSQFQQGMSQHVSVTPLAGNKIFVVGKMGDGSRRWLLVDATNGNIIRQADFQSSFKAVSANGDYYVRGPNSLPPGQSSSMEIVDVAQNVVIGRALSKGLPSSVSTGISLDGRRLLWVADDVAYEATLASGESLEWRVTKLFELDCTEPSAATTDEDSNAAIPCVHEGTGRVAWWDFCRKMVVIRDRDGHECFAAPTEKAEALTWSADGRRLLAHRKDGCSILDIEQRRVIHDASSLRSGVTISPNGRYLGKNVPGRIVLWELDEQRELTVARAKDWQHACIAWLVLSAWAALWGWECKRQWGVNPKQPGRTAWSFAGFRCIRFVHCLPPIAAFIGLGMIKFSPPMSPWWWRILGLVTLVSVVYLLIEIWSLWKGPHTFTVSEANANSAERVAAPGAHRWIWRLLLLGGLLNVAMASWLMFVVSRSNQFMNWTGIWSSTAWLNTQTPYTPVVIIGSALVGLLGLRLVAAGAGASEAELATLRRHQAWSWLYLDLANVSFAVIEGYLQKRSAKATADN